MTNPVIKIVPMPGVPGAPGPRGVIGPKGDPGENGLSGASAYQIAVGNGFNGNESQWLASLVGPKGDSGDQGTQGLSGASAYQIAITNGFVGSEAEWLASLQGAQGSPGQDANTGDIDFSGNNITAHGDMTIGVDVVPGVVNISAYAGVNIETYQDFGLYVNGITPDNKVLTVKDVVNTTDKLAYGSFYDQNSFGPYTANSVHAMSVESTDLSHDVHIGGIENSELVVDKAGKFNISFSAQFEQTNGSGTINIWLRKNGTDVPWSNTKLDISANNPYKVAAWNFFVSAAQYDAFEIMWSSSSNATILKAESAGAHPGVPSVIITVNQVGV